MQQSASPSVIPDEPCLPSAHELNSQLGRLYSAQVQFEAMSRSEEGNFEEAHQVAVIENEIRDMAKPGLYEGYPGDDLLFGFVRLVRVRRANEGANIHTFRVELMVLVDEVNFEPLELDLIEFLGEIYRPTAHERTHRGPRFWHFD